MSYLCHWFNSHTWSSKQVEVANVKSLFVFWFDFCFVLFFLCICVCVYTFKKVLSHHHKTPVAPRGLCSPSPWRQAHPAPNNAIFGAVQRASLFLLFLFSSNLYFFFPQNYFSPIMQVSCCIS